MKIVAVKGYLVSYGLIDMYSDTHNMTDDLALIKFKLKLMITGFARKKIDIKKLMEKSWNEIEALTNGEEMELSILSIALDLIAKNPNKDRNLVLTALAMNLKKESRFSKDEMVVNSKRIVNSFYGLDKEKGR